MPSSLLTGNNQHLPTFTCFETSRNFASCWSIRSEEVRFMWGPKPAIPGESSVEEGGRGSLTSPRSSSVCYKRKGRCTCAPANRKERTFLLGSKEQPTSFFWGVTKSAGKMKLRNVIFRRGAEILLNGHPKETTKDQNAADVKHLAPSFRWRTLLRTEWARPSQGERRATRGVWEGSKGMSRKIPPKVTQVTASG